MITTLVKYCLGYNSLRFWRLGFTLLDLKSHHGTLSILITFPQVFHHQKVIKHSEGRIRATLNNLAKQIHDSNEFIAKNVVRYFELS